MNIRNTLISITIIFVSFTSCKKEAGKGGQASIMGTVWVKDYNSSFTVLNNEYAGADEDVYIIYGNDISYGDKIKASPDGRFEFNYLRKGDYTLYVYSKDTIRNSSGILQVYTKAIERQVTISSKKETVDAGIFTIKK